MMPKITVVIFGDDYFQYSLYSVFFQDYRDIEVIIATGDECVAEEARKMLGNQERFGGKAGHIFGKTVISRGTRSEILTLSQRYADGEIIVFLKAGTALFGESFLSVVAKKIDSGVGVGTAGKIKDHGEW